MWKDTWGLQNLRAGIKPCTTPILKGYKMDEETKEAILRIEKHLVLLSAIENRLHFMSLSISALVGLALGIFLAVRFS